MSRHHSMGVKDFMSKRRVLLRGIFTLLAQDSFLEVQDTGNDLR
jgi:hypothetical protein